jgi:hypothetical protein
MFKVGKPQKKLQAKLTKPYRRVNDIEYNSSTVPNHLNSPILSNIPIDILFSGKIITN